MRLTALEVDGYGYYHDPDRPELGGDLVVESEDGNTLLPPYPGTYTVLEYADSEESANRLARQWRRAIRLHRNRLAAATSAARRAVGRA